MKLRQHCRLLVGENAVQALTGRLARLSKPGPCCLRTSPFRSARALVRPPSKVGRSFSGDTSLRSAESLSSRPALSLACRELVWSRRQSRRSMTPCHCSGATPGCAGSDILVTSSSCCLCNVA
ncbi:unnamed protein product [Ixodes pacificus]